LVINGRNRKKLASAVEDLKGKGFEANEALFDVTNAREVEKAIADIEERIGPIDILVNNAGIIRRAPAADLAENDWEAVIRTNLTAPFLMSKCVGNYMLRRGEGKIINICSLMSELGRDTVAAYASAKGG